MFPDPDSSTKIVYCLVIRLRSRRTFRTLPLLQHVGFHRLHPLRTSFVELAGCVPSRICYGVHEITGAIMNAGVGLDHTGLHPEEVERNLVGVVRDASFLT